MGLLPDTQNLGLRKHLECRQPLPRHPLQRKPLVSDPDMHVPWKNRKNMNFDFHGYHRELVVNLTLNIGNEVVVMETSS